MLHPHHTPDRREREKILSLPGGCPRIAIFSQIEANSKKLPEAYI
jgi:hypothetical protein